MVEINCTRWGGGARLLWRQSNTPSRSGSWLLLKVSREYVTWTFWRDEASASISALTTVTVNYCRAYTATCFIIAMTAVRVCACYCRVTDERWRQTTGRKMFDFLQRCHRRGWGHVTPLLFPPRRRRNVQRTVIVRRRTQIIYFCHSAVAGWWAGCAAETAGQ